LLVFCEFCLRFGIGFADDDRDEIIGQDLARIAAGRGRLPAHVGDICLEYRLGRRGDENTLGVLRSEALAGPRGAGLIEHRRTLQ
jgi:hypothetical protein